MGQLKTSEVRLLIIFCVVVLGLGTYFLYEVYAKKVVQIDAEKAQLEAGRTHLLTLKTEQTSYNEKLVWMNQNQPLARDEFQAKDVLDNVVSVRGIEAAGLVLVSSPPEKPPSKEAYFWAFERRVVVQGPLQNIVQWMTELQSETAFRAITHLHIFPKKQKEPETLTCEVTVEQRYATDEVIAMTTPGAVMATALTPEVQPVSVAPEIQPIPDNVAPDSAAAEEPDAVAPDAPAGVEANQGNPVRPKVRLPNPQAPNDASAASSGTTNGMLSNARRTQRRTPPPPPMQADLDAAQQFAYDNDRKLAPVTTAVVEVELDQVGVEEPVLETDGPLPTAPDEEVVIDPESTGAVGEAWDPKTPGSEVPEPEGEPSPEVPQTN